MSPIQVTRREAPPPPGPPRFIYVGSQRVPIPQEDAPARQLLDFAALAGLSSEFHPDIYRNPRLHDAASAAALAYFAQYPEAVKEAEKLTMEGE
jgi:hypothetical protein